jgi:hypothetical protein
MAGSKRLEPNTAIFVSHASQGLCAPAIRGAQRHLEESMKGMKHGLLAATAAVSLIAGLAAASAQTGGKSELPGVAGGKGDAGAPTKKGASAAQKSDGAKKSGTQTQMKEPGGAKAGRAQLEIDKTPGQGRKPMQKEPGQAQQFMPKAPGQAQQPMQPGAPGVQSEGKAGAQVQLSQEQRTRIKTTISQHPNVNRVQRVNFDIDVGVRVPRTLRLVVLPSPIIEIVPAYRGYLYFVDEEGNLVIVHPQTLMIVAVIPA